MGSNDHSDIDDLPEPSRTDVVLKLVKRTDGAGQTYHIARCDAPISVDLSQCTLFVFTGDRPEISIRRTKHKPRKESTTPPKGRGL